MKPLYIFDIDGTLSDPEHRRHFVDGSQKKNWDEFYRLCFRDTPRLNVIFILNALYKNGADILFFSGRRESCRKDTIQWLWTYTDINSFVLNQKGIITLRPDNDHTKDSILKESWYDSLHNNDKNRLVGTFDDRNQVVDMWRSKNILCCQVAPGDF